MGRFETTEALESGASITLSSELLLSNPRHGDKDQNRKPDGRLLERDAPAPRRENILLNPDTLAGRLTMGEFGATLTEFLPAKPTFSAEVLLVTSDHPRLSALNQVLENSNWRLINSRSVAEATVIIRSQAVGVIVCNQSVCDGTWRELLVGIDSQPNHPKIIVASNSGSSSLWREALALGADYILHMPCDPKDVFRSVGDAWLRWHLTRVPEKQFDSAVRGKSSVTQQQPYTHRR